MMHNAPPPPVQTSELLGVEASAADPAPGPKGPTQRAVAEALVAIDAAALALSRGRAELTHNGGPDLDEAANELGSAPADVATAVRCVAYARDIRGGRAVASATPPPAPIGPDVDMLRAAVVGCAVAVERRSFGAVDGNGELVIDGARALGEACRLYLRALEAVEPLEVARTVST
jgi:hypothetical protein